MSRDVIVKLTNRVRLARKMAREDNTEGLKRTGMHKAPAIKSILKTSRSIKTKQRTAVEASERSTAIQDRKRELANRKHDIREILKYKKKAA